MWAGIDLASVKMLREGIQIRDNLYPIPGPILLPNIIFIPDRVEFDGKD